MRIEIVKCDVCGAKYDDARPQRWRTIRVDSRDQIDLCRECDELSALRKLRSAAISWMDCERDPDESRGMHMDREQLLTLALHEAIDACRTPPEANDD